MNKRLQQFLSAENITQSQFADTIGVARASISHILAGRNKPGFDFIENMARHYPSLNLEWLITGKGRMYKDNSAPAPVKDISADLFGYTDIPLEKTAATTAPAAFNTATAAPAATSLEEDVDSLFTAPQSPASQRVASPSPAPQPVIKPQIEPEMRSEAPKTVRISNSQPDIKARRISRIMVFYDDNTFEEFK